MASFTYELGRRESNIKDHTLTGLIMSAESINLSVVFYNIANEGQSNILAQGLQVVRVFYTTCVAQICPISCNINYPVASSAASVLSVLPPTTKALRGTVTSKLA